MEKLLTISEAAMLINVHPETLRRWDNEKILVAVRINDRGDRRYKESDLLEFMKTNSKLIKYEQKIIYKGYEIEWHNNSGFKSMQANFSLIGKLVVKSKNIEFIGFAFIVSGLTLFSRVDRDDGLDDLAVNKIKEYIDKNLIHDGDIFTFEFTNDTFLEVQNPEWWESKYSKTLVDGLRVEADHSCSTDSKNTGWRVILNFKSKNNGLWLTTPFGHPDPSCEYFVWIDSKELIKMGYPNTAKGAEILAVEYGVKRFNETKDENGNRSILKIKERNSACFNGKFTKDSLLPE
jgi:excisionase family DNA binding protein